MGGKPWGRGCGRISPEVKIKRYRARLPYGNVSEHWVSRTGKIYVVLKSDYFSTAFLDLMLGIRVNWSRRRTACASARHFAFRALLPSLLGWSVLGFVRDRTRIRSVLILPTFISSNRYKEWIFRKVILVHLTRGRNCVLTPSRQIQVLRQERTPGEDCLFKFTLWKEGWWMQHKLKLFGP